MSDMWLKVFPDAKDGVEWSAHIVRYGSSEHLEEVILQFELLVFDNMGDTPYHDHLVRLILK